MKKLQLEKLKESNEFLNKVLQNINTALFLVDEDVKVREFNDSFEKLFCQDRQRAIGTRCGNAIGCSYAVDEDAECGDTSFCSQCKIRESILKALSQQSPTFKEIVNRDFVIGGERLNKHFSFSTQPLSYHDYDMVMLMMDDLSDLERQRRELEEKQLLIEDDLQAAAGIQQCLLPDKQPFSQRLRWAWDFAPCQEIGGDILNAYALDESHAALYMLDISGHGVPSALVTVSVSQSLSPSGGLVRDTAGRIVPPKEVVEALDSVYPLERFSKTFTIFYGVLDLEEMVLDYCNAGHPAPVVARAGGELDMLHSTGPLVGLGGLLPYEPGRTRLGKKDKVIFYSDGVTEMHNQQADLYGEERFLNIIRTHQGLRIESLLNEIYQDVLAFGGKEKPKDDISLMGLEIIA